MPLFCLSLAVVLCTSFYMGRTCTIVFFRKRSDSKHGHGHGLRRDGHQAHPSVTESSDSGHAHESNWPVTVPLIILAVLSLIAGYIPFHHLLPAAAEEAAEHGGHLIAILSISFALAGFLLSFFIYRTKEHAEKSNVLAAVLQKKYFFDDFYDQAVIQGFQENTAKASDWFERIIVVEGGANGTARITRYFGDILRKLQTGLIQSYAFIFAAGLTAILYFVIFWKQS